MADAAGALPGPGKRKQRCGVVEMQWVRKVFGRKFSQLRYQVVLFLFGVAVLPILVLTFINMSETSGVFLQKNQETLEDNLHLSNVNLQNALNDYRKLMIQICTDSDYYENLSLLASTTSDQYQYRNVTQSLMDTIRSNILLFPEVQAVGVVANNGASYLYAQQRQKTRLVTAFFNDHTEDFLSQCSTLASQVMEPIASDSEYYDDNNPMFYIVVPSLHYDRMQIEGCMVMFISPDTLQNLINNPASHAYGWTDTVIVSVQGRVLVSKNYPIGTLFSSLPLYPTLSATTLSETPQMVAGNLLVSRAEQGLFDTQLYALTDYSAFTGVLTRLWGSNLLVMGGFLMGILMLAYLLTKQFIRTVEQVAQAMQQVDETKLDVQVPERSRNELGVIERSFNVMTRQIRILLEQNRQQVEHMLSLNQKACQAELKAMELQINPHFLFNTIDAINWMAIQEGNPLLSDQLTRLSTTLRHTVYHVNATVTMQDELSWIKAYLELHQCRFAGRFRYRLFVDEATLSLRIHKLLLQPFLENSILHGFENLSRPGMLYIHSHLLGGRYLLLRVEDNGSGITPKKLAAMNRMFDGGEEFGGVGLNNIAYRLREYYPGARIHAASSNCWTRFTLYIPLTQMEASADAEYSDRG